jgi:hypothetical protein
MTFTRRELNENVIAWTPVEKTGIFTSRTTVAEWRHEMPYSGDAPSNECLEEFDEDSDDIAASDAAKAEGVAGAFDDLVRELGL